VTVPLDDQLPPALDGILKSLREHLDEDLRALTQELSRAAEAERARVASDAALRQQAAAELEQVRQHAAAETDAIRRRATADVEDARRLAHTQVDDVQRQMQQQLASARAESAARGQQIIDGMRAIDSATSLTDVLGRLANAAAMQAERTLVLIVRHGMLVESHRVGFPGSQPRVELRVQDAGFMADVVPTGTAATRAGGALPAFASGTDARDAAAMPVTVAGSVVAVLYCDATRQAMGTTQWPAAIEVLARYASRVLETITVQQATGLWPPTGVAQGSHVR